MFTAHNWKGLPKCSPEEDSYLSLAERVATHEAKFKSYDDTLSTIQAQLLLLEIISLRELCHSCLRL